MQKPEVLVGTASWTDPSLIQSKLFYPKEASTPETRLRYYAAHFPLVEVDTIVVEPQGLDNGDLTQWKQKTR